MAAPEGKTVTTRTVSGGSTPWLCNSAFSITSTTTARRSPTCSRRDSSSSNNTIAPAFVPTISPSIIRRRSAWRPRRACFLPRWRKRSRRLRFGPLLYVTPMYHPLRVAEEVVMLDHMSRGRLELGLGRGASPIEIAGFDVDPANAPAMNREATDLILKALTSEVVSHEGKFYRCKNVRIEAKPLQKPY